MGISQVHVNCALFPLSRASGRSSPVPWVCLNSSSPGCVPFWSPGRYLRSHRVCLSCPPGTTAVSVYLSSLNCDLNIFVSQAPSAARQGIQLNKLRNQFTESLALPAFSCYSKVILQVREQLSCFILNLFPRVTLGPLSMVHCWRHSYLFQRTRYSLSNLPGPHGTDAWSHLGTYKTCFTYL